MAEKSYLKNQVYLPGFSAYDLFTDEEYDEYMKIVEAKNELNRIESQGSTEEERKEWINKKKQAREKLAELIKLHEGRPRTVRLKNVIYYPKDADYDFPAGVTWENMNFSKKIAEFSSELTRAMGLKHMDHTFDQVVIKWKSLDMLHQLVTDGFYIPLLNDDGSITNKHYHFMTASAGQLRRDKFVCISDDMWDVVHERIECGLTWDVINQQGGCNVNKYLSYLALPMSATDEWTDFDIDRTIVIPEFKSNVTDKMMYIKPKYEYSEEVCTVEIDHTDGCGMMLPSVSERNFMVRGPFIKGLLISFDYLRFCAEKNVRPVITDIYGVEHDLIKEDIQIVFTESMFKMWKYYPSWEAYKAVFKSCKAKFGKTNYEEDQIDDALMNYQFIQTLTDFTDDEVKEFTKDEHAKILGITKNMESMLKALKAKKTSANPYKAALAYYPEMLWEGYTRTQLKDTRKRMLLDAKSGRIRIRNKRLFAIPDLYAACEYWFQHIENPEGLLKKNEVACKIYRQYDKADVLRSPHLYCEHFVVNISHDDEVYRWFSTNGIATSCHSLISRVLQFDQWSN